MTVFWLINDSDRYMTDIWQFNDIYVTVFCKWQFYDSLMTDMWHIYENSGTYIDSEYQKNIMNSFQIPRDAALNFIQNQSLSN